MTKLVIQLEPNSQGHLVFFPGHVLNGVIELSLNEVKKFRGCYVVVYGYARAHWTETRTRTEGTGDNRRTVQYTVHYEGKEVFINSKTYLFGHHGAESREMQPGIHRYNFSCQLPDLIPATMHGVHGNIGYHVEAVLDIPWRFDKEVKVPITVVRHDDLNMYPELRMAQQMDKVKTFCCLFCESGPLLLTVSVPHGGFAAGQKLPVVIRYKNSSNVAVEHTVIKLIRSMSFTSHSPESKTRTDSEHVVAVQSHGVDENKTYEFTTNLDIPRILMNSNDRFCRVVRVTYCLEVEGVVGGCHSNPKVYIPIVIGSVPIQMSNGFDVVEPQNNYPPPSAPADPLLPPSAPVFEELQKPDLPPSFEEAMRMQPPQPQVFAPTTSGPSPGWNVLEPSVPTGKQ